MDYLDNVLMDLLSLFVTVFLHKLLQITTTIT